MMSVSPLLCLQCSLCSLNGPLLPQDLCTCRPLCLREALLVPSAQGSLWHQRPLEQTRNYIVSPFNESSASLPAGP